MHQNVKTIKQRTRLVSQLRASLVRMRFWLTTAGNRGQALPHASLIIVFGMICLLRIGPVLAEDAAAEKSAASAPAETANTNKGEWAAREKANELPRQHLDPQTTQQTVLTTELKKNEQVWLESPKDKGKFLAVAVKEASGTPQGAVVIIPDYGQHAQWPVLVKPFGELLPDKGWYVLSASMPEKYSRQPPDRAFEPKALDEVMVNTDIPAVASSRTADAENKTSDTEVEAKEPTEQSAAEQGNASDDGIDSPDGNAVAIDLGDGTINSDDAEKGGADNELVATAAEVARARMRSALGYVKSKGYENIVLVGIGMGASHTLKYLEENKGSLPRRGFAVILVDAKFSEDDAEAFSKSFDKGFQSPMLDIVNTLDLPSMGRAESRKRLSRSLSMSGYQQIKMPLTSQATKDPQSVLMHRISAWVSVKAPGTKATKYKR